MRQGIFDLQNLSQDACAHLLESHEKDLMAFSASKDVMARFFKDTQLNRITGYTGDSMGLVDLLKYSQEKKVHAPICYAVVVDTLMNQDEKPFLMVWDEFNCYYDRGHYFHRAYDDSVRNSIPYENISLFEHAIRAIALSLDEDPDMAPSPKLMKRGGIIVGITESHAVPRKVTDQLTASAVHQASSESSTRMHVIEVPRFSDQEADCILANMEVTGIGRLRLDRGEILMNEQEVAFMKMVSGNIGQQLLDATVM
jgi:hypothetical protein